MLEPIKPIQISWLVGITESYAFGCNDEQQGGQKEKADGSCPWLGQRATGNGNACCDQQQLATIVFTSVCWSEEEKMLVLAAGRTEP